MLQHNSNPKYLKLAQSLQDFDSHQQDLTHWRCNEFWGFHKHLIFENWVE